MEYTDGFEYELIQFCEANNILYTRIPGRAKNSLDITRGKNDKVDAARIAQYGEEKHKLLNAYKPLNVAVAKLKELLNFKKRMVRENAGYKSGIKERRHIYGGNKKDIVVKMLEQKQKENVKKIASVELALLKILTAGEKMRAIFTLLTSVRGFCKINALTTIAYTEYFVSFTNPRSYAVYVGAIPFDRSSSTSISEEKG